MPEVGLDIVDIVDSVDSVDIPRYPGTWISLLVLSSEISIPSSSPGRGQIASYAMILHRRREVSKVRRSYER